MQSVLIVDDNADNLYFLEVLLKSNGFEVRTASNGDEALQTARNTPPDLIVSDILMPVMDGYVLCHEWRADERLKRIPFIFYTATFTEQKDIKLALSLGADRCIIKPQEPDALMEIIHDVLAAFGGSEQKSPTDISKTEEELLKEYNDTLFRKLEKKMEDLRRVNRELAEGEQHFRRVIIESPVPIAVSQPDGRIELVNNRFVDTFGYTRDDIPDVDSWWLTAYPDPDYRKNVTEIWQNILDRTVHDGGTVHAAEEFNITCKDGRVRIVEIYGAWIANRLVVTFFDVTERKLAEEELKKKTIETEQFFYSVSHDLRSPLVTVKTFMGYLVKDIAEGNQEQLAQDIQYINGAADKMKLLLDELLELSRIGRIETPPVRITLREVLHEVLDVLAGTIKEHNAEILLPDVDQALFGDRPRLFQIWQNLIENGINFSCEGTVPRITISVHQQGVETVFSVKDNGIGIDAQYHGKIFGIFEKLNAKSPGAGMGLSMVQRIVEKNGGRIWVESEGRGTGACFFFTLPHALLGG